MRRLLVLGAACLVSSGCGSCVDLEEARAYPCQRDDGGEADPQACPEGWRCGLEGRCHAVGEPGPYACAGDDDCEGGWHCGVEGRCYSLEVGEAHPCRADAGDCAVGWRCGLNGRCQDRAVAAAYPCETDEHCEQGWRCSPDGVCLDALEERFGPSGDGGVSAHRASPVWRQRPTAVAASEEFDVYDPCGKRTYASAFSVAGDGGVFRVMLMRDYSLPTDGGTADAGACPDDELEGSNGFQFRRPRRSALVLKAPWSFGQVADVAEVGDRTWVLNQAGGLYEYTWNLTTGTGQSRSIPLAFQATRLRVEDSERNDGYPLVVAWSKDRYQVLNGQTGNSVLSSTPSLTDGGTFIRDMLAMTNYSADRRVWLAATDDGLYFARRVEPTGEFELLDGGLSSTLEWAATTPPVNVAVVPLTCNPYGGDVYAPVRMQLGGNRYTSDLWLTMQNKSGGPRNPYLFGQLRQDSAPQFLPCPTPPGLEYGWHYTYGDFDRCDTCEDGSIPVEVHSGRRREGDPDELFVERRCRALDGGNDTVTYTFQNGCPYSEAVVNSELYQPQTVLSVSSARRKAYANERGLLWFTESDNFERRSAWLDRLPLVVWGRRGALNAVAPDVPYLTGDIVFDPTTPRAVLSGMYTYHPTHGMVLTQGDGINELPVQSGVEGRPDWVVLRVPESELVTVLEYVWGEQRKFSMVALFSQTQTYTAPFRAAAAPLSDGGTLLVASAHDAILSAEVTGNDGFFVTDSEGNVVASELPVRTVPLGRSPIVSLSLLPPNESGDGGVFAEGYAVTQSRLFRYRAINRTVWRSDEVLVPPGELVEVWTHGAFGRVGYRDGRVVSLPSRVAIAPPLSESEGPVFDFASTCAETFALARGGLYRVRTDGQAPMATWERVPFSTSEGDELSPPVSKGSLYAVDGRLYVFGARGTMLEVQMEACP